ncbi:hypothetical protein F8M41_014019 [Gigaspora margarita]|uniref:Uncharacterized protein n=1 Tax=Gigaspora margarita TaxID=4874 RepID=A0A8H4ARW6_GIGMA|nr:hypothetical protein F8M41_014019 [Gigaspora margarita]
MWVDILGLKNLSFHDDVDSVEDIYKLSSDSSDSENDTISSENELETNTLACSQSELEFSELSKSESSNSKSNLEEYKVNANKKKISFSDTKSSKKHKSAQKNLVTPLLLKKSSKDTRSLEINNHNMINAEFIALKDPILNYFTSNFLDKEYEKFWHEITKANILLQNIQKEQQLEPEISWSNSIEINFIHKIIPNDVVTICCKISSPLEKIIQVPSAMINSGANCLVISKGIIKLL